MPRDDPWSEDDPAVLRVREAERAVAARLTAAPTPPARPVPAVSPQARVARLIARVRAGDLSVVDELRRLVSHVDNVNPND